MRLLTTLAVCLLAGSAYGSPYTTPVIVSSLEEHKASTSGPKPENLHPLEYPNNDDHQWVSQMHKLQLQIETHDKTLEQLNEDVEKAREHRARLHKAQKLFHAMVSLHQAETVLSLIDKRVDGLKDTVKKIGDHAEDIMKDRESLKSQMEDEIKEGADKLAAIRSKLAHQDSMLKALCGKRTEVASIVSDWRTHVDKLRAAHGLPTRNGGSLVIPALPRPPADGEESADEDADGEASAGEAQAEGSGSDEVKKAPVEEVKAESGSGAAEVDLDDVTASEKELAATQSSIHELLNVHLPKITGAAKAHAAKAASFLQVTSAALDEQEA